jgi:capsular polysaccharide biosynthesis protein
MDIRDFNDSQLIKTASELANSESSGELYNDTEEAVKYKSELLYALLAEVKSRELDDEFQEALSNDSSSESDAQQSATDDDTAKEVIPSNPTAPVTNNKNRNIKIAIGSALALGLIYLAYKSYKK